MSNIDIFSSAKPQNGEFFKFKEVGDAIQGTYVDVRPGTDSFGNTQKIYVIQDSEGKVWNLGFRDGAIIIHERMAGIRFGQIVGFRFDEERDSKKTPGIKAKIIRIYADPKLVDKEWLSTRKEIEANYSSMPAEPKDAAGDDFYDNFDNIGKEKPNAFVAPETAGAASGNLPTGDGKPKNEALDAIRNLAKTKGLTTDKMTEEEADKVIEQFTGLSLTEENLTKVIIKLTGFSK